MNLTLLTAGVVFLGAGIIGGGLKAFGVEVPLIQSTGRQALLAIVGLIFLSAALLNLKPSVSQNLPAPNPILGVATPLEGNARKVTVDAKKNCVRPDEYEEMLQTGVLLRPGERVKISATGRWSAARFDKNQERQSGPDGLD